MEEQSDNEISPIMKKKFNYKKSFLDLSNISKNDYNKQVSINNTSEICEFFTSITTNQKDISKKYEQLFTLIKKFGKEIKYLLNTTDKYNDILVDTKDYINRVKKNLNASAVSEFESI
ncbi:conserved protein, unknown function, partial [Hepatocystis sp. ex Piliocolobus tephrosceles]